MDRPPARGPSRRDLMQLLAASAGAVGLGGLAGTTVAQDEDDVPTAGEFPTGETVGLERIAEGVGAPTDYLSEEIGGEPRHYLVTQPGQVYVYDGEPEAMGAAEDGATEDGAADDGAAAGDDAADDGAEVDCVCDEMHDDAAGNETAGDDGMAGDADGVVGDNETGTVGNETADDGMVGNDTDAVGNETTGQDGETTGQDDAGEDGGALDATGEDAPTAFVFDGDTEAWIGREPDEIDGQENPTLRLEAGRSYEFTWVNADGQPHNVVLLSGDDEVLERTEIVSEQGAEQTLEFEATEEMERYVCEVHPGSMTGEVVVTGDDGQQAGDGQQDDGQQDGVDGQQDAAGDQAAEPPEGWELFLDLSDAIVDLGIGQLGGYDERGLFSLVFHPDFEEHQTAYVYYSAPERHDLGFDHTDVLAELEVDEDGLSADPDSERAIMEVPQPQDNHNGGQLAFGPDGSLYISVGDGGNVHDIGIGHAEDWYDENQGGNAQDTTQNRLGGILRIEVDPESDEEAEGPRSGAYEVPDENPLVDVEDHFPEYYAWGFRNPWGMSIDDDGTVFVADAGQHTTESLYVVGEGGNYSWNVKEGSRCFSPASPLEPPEDCPDQVEEDLPDPRGGEELRDPIAEYRHDRISEAFVDSSVVVGGHRYAGDALDVLDDSAFVFGNWSSQGVVEADGEVLVAHEPDDADESEWETGEADWELTELEFAGADDGRLQRYLYGVERDHEGELYLLTNTDYRPDAPTGEVYRVVPEGEGEDVPAPEETATVDAGTEDGDEAADDGGDDEEFATPGDGDGEDTEGEPEEQAPDAADDGAAGGENATEGDVGNVTDGGAENATDVGTGNATNGGDENASDGGFDDVDEED